MSLYILVVFLPLIVVPVVLLFGFAGCASLLQLDEVTYVPVPAKPEAPFNLRATPVSTSVIDLAWEHKSAGGVRFTVTIEELPGSLKRDEPVAGPTTTLSAGNLREGTAYSFTVVALVNNVASDPAGPVIAKTLKWETAYTHQLQQAEVSFSNATMVQRIDKSLLLFTGRRVRITVNGSSVATVIQRIHISQAAKPGAPLNPTPQPWDSSTDLTAIVPNGITLGPGAVVLLPETDYALGNTEDLIVALDITSGAARGLDGAANVKNSAAFVKAPITTPQGFEAGKADRTAGYTPTNNRIYFIEKIEVLTG